MNELELKKTVELLGTFSTGMLVTQRGSELRSRPMAIADHTNAGHIWFITSIDSEKLDELTENPNVNVSMQSGSSFLSVSGAARATRDASKIEQLWNPAQSLWFVKGKEDPTVVLLEIVPTYVEYWDRSGVEAIKFMFAAAKSAVSGEKPDDDVGRHGKLELSKTAAARKE